MMAAGALRKLTVFLETWLKFANNLTRFDYDETTGLYFTESVNTNYNFERFVHHSTEDDSRFCRNMTFNLVLSFIS